MTVSEDGTVPEHLMARLKQLEARRQPRASNPLESPIRNSELPHPSGSSGKGKTTRPGVLPSPGSEEESSWPSDSCCWRTTRTPVESSRLRILAIGKVRHEWIKTGSIFIANDCRSQHRGIADGTPEKEAEAIRAARRADERLVVLMEQGETLDRFPSPRGWSSSAANGSPS